MASSMKINLILTQTQQVRSWFQDEVLQSLSKIGSLNIFAPENFKFEIETLSNTEVNYFNLQHDPAIEEKVFLQLLARNFHADSYRLIARNYLRFRKLNLLRPSTFIWLKSYFFRLFLFFLILKSPRFSRKVAKQVDQFINLQVLAFPNADMNIVVANTSDLRTEIVKESLNLSGATWIMIVENWDNISSKLDTNRNPPYLGVWSPQTARHANKLYGFPMERIQIIGSARVNRRTITQLEKSIEKSSKKKGENFSVFYPGAGVQYESLEFILDLKRSLNKNPYNVNLVYRPHPLSIKEHGLNHYKNWEFEVDIDWPQIADSNLSDWPVLDSKLYERMYRSDLVIGTPSTFLLEAIAVGMPILLDMRSLRRKPSPRSVFKENQHFQEILASDLIPKMYCARDAQQLSIEVLNSNQNLAALRFDLIHISELGFGHDLAKTILELPR